MMIGPSLSTEPLRAVVMRTVPFSSARLTWPVPDAAAAYDPLSSYGIGSAMASGCSTMLLAWVMTPGQSTLPSGTLMRSNR